MRVLIVDNFDSFTHNIAQYLFDVCGEVPVVLPNTHSLEQLGLERFDAVVLSPGPGHPARAADFGVCSAVLECATVPILGVCLGQQGINCFFGGQVGRAPAPVHGYRSRIRHDGSGLFAGITQDFEVVRYHSLVCTEVAPCLRVTARSGCGLVMGLAHRQRPIWGVQFHPESIDSQHGRQLLRNFVRLVHEGRQDTARQTVAEVLRAVGGPERLDLDFQPLTPAPAPLDTFASQFGGRAQAFWLDSELAERSQARYSLMGACDADSALVFAYDVGQRVLTVQGPRGQRTVAGDVFELMAAVMQYLRPAQPARAPFPFTGGLVGYFGYELKALNGVANAHTSDLPDALFYLPQSLLVFDHHDHTAWHCHLWGPRQPLLPLSRVRPEPAPEFCPGPVDACALGLADAPLAYQGKIQACLQQIADGESYEICLTNRAHLPCTEAPLSVYRRMRAISPVPNSAFVDTGTFAVLSASPETFVKIDTSGRITSRPIKGTRPRGATFEEDRALREELASSAKDRAENLMIVDLVRHDLNGVCVPGSVRVPASFAIESYSSVHQLVSTVEGQLRADIEPFAAIKACFPGGSMTGAPKRRTLAIIDRLETSARGVYAGALGWIGVDGYTDLSIVIRTAVLKDGVARFGIGGAIVAGSDPAQEMQETLVKASVPYHSIRR